MRKRYRFYLVAALALVLFMGYILWSSIWHQGITPLGNSYRYWHTDNGVIIDWLASSTDETDRIQRYIDRAERKGVECEGMPKVGPDVDGYRVYSSVIVGHVSAPSAQKAASSEEWGTPGYFIIDVKTDEIYRGMNKQKWTEKLQEFGIDSSPELYEPWMFDELLGRNQPHELF